MDVRAALTEDLHLGQIQWAAIPTGLKIAMPQGFECQVRPRSVLPLNTALPALIHLGRLTVTIVERSK